jgi:hypothetical protein
MVSRPAILDRIIQPEQGGFSAEHVRYVLSLDFSPAEHTKYAELSAKAQQGALNADEQADLDDLLTVNALLMILQSKARVSLKKHNSAA